jgi:hypothetical protein
MSLNRYVLYKGDRVFMETESASVDSAIDYFYVIQPDFMVNKDFRVKMVPTPTPVNKYKSPEQGD